MARLSGCSATRSALLPASAIIMFSLACRWSSFTHALALSNDDFFALVEHRNLSTWVFSQPE